MLLTLTPPRWEASKPLLALAAVARVGLTRRRVDVQPAGMGLRFIGLEGPDRRALTRALLGLPPPLPGHAGAPPPALTMAAPPVAPPAPAQAEAVLRLDGGSALTFVSEGPLLTGGRVRFPGAAAREGASANVIPLRSYRTISRRLPHIVREVTGR